MGKALSRNTISTPTWQRACTKRLNLPGTLGLCAPLPIDDVKWESLMRNRARTMARAGVNLDVLAG
jgi:hypothetical protein